VASYHGLLNAGKRILLTNDAASVFFFCGEHR